MTVPVHHRHRNAYHFTSVDNLESIIETGLFSTNQKIARRISHVNVADEGIQGRRAVMQVPNTNGRCVHDYVPFILQKRPCNCLFFIKKCRSAIYYLSFSFYIITRNKEWVIFYRCFRKYS